MYHFTFKPLQFCFRIWLWFRIWRKKETDRWICILLFTTTRPPHLTLQSLSKSGEGAHQDARARQNAVLKESKKNVLKMSIAIVLAFAFCWFLMHLIAMFLRLVASLYGFKPQVFYLVTPTAQSTAAYTSAYLVKNTGKV